MTQLGIAPEQAADVRVPFGPGPTMNLSLDLAAAVLAEVWKASPERFGNFVKKAMITLYTAPASSNGHRP
jgi:hypothetical protein